MGVTPGFTIGCSGETIPAIGLGTIADPRVDAETTKLAVIEAIKAGYRHFDTAYAYLTEQPVGEAIVEALRLGLAKSRDEFFITTKLWCNFAVGDQVVPAIKMSLKNLQMEYVDMYLIHVPLRMTEPMTTRPVPREHIMPMDLKSVWEGMEECKKLGLTKGIGVSNFSCKRIEELLSFCKIPPAVNQVELNPFWRQKELLELCKAKGIHITAYSPLGAHGTSWGDDRILGCNVIEEIAKARGKTTAQVSLRWGYQQGASMVPKSFNKERMKQNLDIFDWSLTEEEINKINQLPLRKVSTFANLFGPHDFVLEMDADI